MTTTIRQSEIVRQAAAAIILCALLPALLASYASARQSCPLYPCASTSTAFNNTTAVGDLDGDSDQDVVIGTSNSVHVYLNDGFGVFTLGSQNPVQSQPRTIRIVDIEPDGDQDIIAANESSGSISVLRNSGSGGFLATQNALCGSQPQSLAVGDLDADGDIDAVVVNTVTPGTVSIMTNQGGGVFVKTATLPVGAQPNAIALGRLNNDAALDIVVAYRTSPGGSGGVLAIMLNNGSGVFGPLIVELETAGLIQGVRASDLEPDADQDIVAVVSSPVRLINDGFGGFKAAGMPPGAVASGVFDLADIDGDGRPELAGLQSSGSGDRAILHYVNAPAGAFAQPQSYLSEGNPSSVTIADMDGDGLRDIQFGFGAGFAFLRNGGAGTFAGEISVAQQQALRQLFPRDLDADGDQDVVAGREGLAGGFSVFTNNGGLSFSAPQTYMYGGINASFRDMALSDVDGDGDEDAVVSAEDARVYVVRNTGSGVFAGVTSFDAGGSGTGGLIAAADLDNDNDIDLAVPRPNTQNSGTSMFLLKNTGAGVFEPPMAVTTGTTPTAAAAGDMDADGDQDLVVTNFGFFGGTAAVSVFRNQPLGTFTSVQTMPVDGRPASVTLGDLDTDGDIDAVVPLSSTLSGGLANTIAVVFNSGLGVLSPPVYYTVGTNSIIASIRDVSGDGRPDIITVAYSTSGAWVLTQQPDGTFTPTRYNSLDSPLGLAVEDFDGDDLPDIMISHQSVQRLCVLRHQTQFASILEQPADQTVVAGESVQFHADVAPATGLDLRWLRNGVALVDDGHISGSTTNTLLIDEAFSADAALYRLRVSSEPCVLESLEARLTVLCTADVSPPAGDGTVDINDLLEVINNWGACPRPCPPRCTADIDPVVTGDCQVDINDLLAVINAWGPCP